MRSALAIGPTFALALIARAAPAARAEPRDTASNADRIIDYSAPAACPPKEAFVSDLRARLGKSSALDREERRFEIRIAESRGTFRGTLEILDPLSTRAVEGSTCAEVTRALAVFLALAVSAHAKEKPPEPSAYEPPPDVDGPVEAWSAEPAPRAKAALRPKPPLTVSFDLQGLATAGVTPGIAPGGAVAAGFAWPIRPAVRLVARGGALFAHGRERVEPGAMAFSWYVARIDVGIALDVRPFRFAAGPAIRAGALSVAAERLPGAEGRSVFWTDAGVYMRVDGFVTPALGISLVLEGATPFNGKAFGIRGRTSPVHATADIIALLSLGLTLETSAEKSTAR